MKKSLVYFFQKIVFILLPLALLISCDSSVRVYRVGVSQCSDDDWRRKMNGELLREEMFCDDIELEIRSADDSNEKQIADIRYFISNGFDAIIVSSNEAEAITPVIHEAYESGIPVIVFDRSTTDTVYTAFRGADNRAIGRTAARLAHDWLGDTLRVLELYGRPGSRPAYDRGYGFHSVMNELGLEDRIITAPGRWTYEDAYLSADSVFALHRDVNLVFAHNDRMAIAARAVADKYGLPDVKIIGVDAAPEIGIRAVADSVIDATLFYPTQGGDILQTTRAILHGEPFVRDSLYFSAAPVDINSARMLLRQNETLVDETAKLEILKDMVDEYWDRHSAQTILLYVIITALILLAGVIFMLLRTYWAHVRHQEALEVKNRQLEESAAEIKSLYEQYQEAMQSKLVFFTNVSHDLRTPLTLIADPVSQLAQADNLTPWQHTLMRLADKNVKILRRLINQILDFRKYENGKLSLNLTEVDLRKEIGDWAEAFRIAATRRHIRFAVDFPDDIDTHAAIDVERFQRVFFNLISNAFKFTPANGRVTVSFTLDPDTVVMRVVDTGKGMSRESLAHIFERFYQVETIDPAGSGIGLAVTKAFVELHGGTIGVESTEGEGTVFTVTIPRRHVNVAGESLPQQSAVQLSSEVPDELEVIDTDMPDVDSHATTVLVIDDNEDIRILLKTLLSDTYTVITATGGEQGIRLASKYIPDLIICDVMMPGIDGLETCRRLKNETITSHIPVLMLTACSMDEQRVEGYRCGADAYISKPFDSAMLLARCEALLINRRKVQEALAAHAAAPAVAHPSTAAPVATGGIDDEFYNRFVALVEKEMSDSEMSVEALAGSLGLSRVQFYRKIKALTNYSPAELVRIMRLKRADILLKTTSQTVSEIAYAIGFSSPSYFSKCYKDYFGESPTDVQRRTSQSGL